MKQAIAYKLVYNYFFKEAENICILLVLLFTVPQIHEKRFSRQVSVELNHKLFIIEKNGTNNTIIISLVRYVKRKNVSSKLITKDFS